MPDLAQAYADARKTMSDLARSAAPGRLQTRVPACPAWDVKDLIAHVTGIATAVSTGEGIRDINLALFWDPNVAAAREEFVDAEIKARRDLPLEEIIAEWERSSAELEPMMRGEKPFPAGAPAMGEWVVLTDLGVHHHDLRGALGAPGDRESLATGLSLRSYVETMRMRTAAMGLPVLRIVAGSRSWTTGEGEPVATLTADPFELARAAAGRRSPDQLRSLAWDGDPEPFMELFYPYGMRTDPLEE
ncbi:MAG: maleylpyruvate isomerase family mycothiol-dependent enzyme [Actinomycetota bacterium]|nr:maleylpyruvate isomerase family mycothiol-dependent enzyme [Actinomycetota bacterium]